MQEDFDGLRRVLSKQQYIKCTRCEKITLRKDALTIQSDVLSDTKSEYEIICPECQKALIAGEKELPLS